MSETRRNGNPQIPADATNRPLLDFRVSGHRAFRLILWIEPHIVPPAVVVQDATVVTQMAFQFLAFHGPLRVQVV